MNIPQSDDLTTAKLAKVFSNTTATYKFFWLLSILQIHARTGELKISVWDIVARMVANAWYPIHFFRLSFGKSDSLFKIVMELQKITNIPIDAKAETVANGLISNIENTLVKRELSTLTKNVPYRFLSPWFQYVSEEDVIRRSQYLENNCLYSLSKSADEFFIEINPAWDTYLHSHFNILTDFAYWNLTQFLQSRNPNVPAISNKLVRPEARNSLRKQHLFWDEMICVGGPVRCIYTGKELHAVCFDLDHFMPWSFVAHDMLWNLIPADGSINSSKSNKLPDLNEYLPRLAALQQHSICTAAKTGKQYAVLDDYASLGFSVSELAAMPSENFLEVYERTFSPLNQIALNMGFETWKI